MKGLRVLFAGLGTMLLALGAPLMALPAAAQTSVPDFTQFGFPQVMGSVVFTPGQATTLTAGNQTVQIPADMLSKQVKFELLEGDPSFFASGVEAGKEVIATFAFRVTDMNTGQLIGKFDKPVLWSLTDPRVSAQSEVYNTSAANPPKITDNPTAATINGNTMTHPFGGAGVGWLAVGPATSTAPAGMPSTGAGDSTGLVVLVGLLGLVLVGTGVLLDRRARTNI